MFACGCEVGEGRVGEREDVMWDGKEGEGDGGGRNVGLEMGLEMGYREATES